MTSAKYETPATEEGESVAVEAEKPWFVYLLKCSNGCLYAGITTDVQQRLKTHNAGKGSRYVRAHRPAKLVAFTASGNRSTASSLEYAVKSLTRPQKVALARKWRAAAGLAGDDQRSAARINAA